MVATKVKVSETQTDVSDLFFFSKDVTLNFSKPARHSPLWAGDKLNKSEKNWSQFYSFMRSALFHQEDLR